MTFLVYLPALKNGFVKWDDPDYIYGNPHIRSIDLSFFKWAFFEFHAANWHPLTWLSHAMDYALWGLDPWGHHLTSVVLHCLNTFLVVLLVIRMATAYRDGKSDAALHSVALHDWSSLTAGAITGLLFGLHPVHVESVAWATGRKDVLSGAFFFLSLLYYARYVSHLPGAETKGAAGQAARRSYLAAVSLFVLALMSKPIAVVLPVVLLILDWCPFDRLKGSARSALYEKIPFFVLAAVSSVLTVAAQRSGGAIKELAEYPLGQRVLVGINAIVAYLGKMLLPLGLSPFYPYPTRVSPASAGYTLPLLIVIGVSIACVYYARRRRLWAAVWAYYLVTLLPVLGIIQVGLQAMADRYTYLPSIGPFLLAGVGVVAGIEKSYQQGRAAFRAGILMVIAAAGAAMAYGTVRQVRVWQDTLSLWTRVAEVVSSRGDDFYRTAYLVHYNLGSAYYEENRLGEAVLATQRAISLNPSFDEAHFNLGNIFLKQNRVADAIASYQDAVRLKPASVSCRVNLGIAYRGAGQLDSAVQQFREAARLDPTHAEAHLNLGVAYMNGNRMEDAIAELRTAARLKPDYAMAHLNLGVAYRKQNRVEEAMREFQDTVRLRPDLAEARYELGMTYRGLNRIDDARRELQAALGLRPDFAAARDSLRALAARGLPQP